MVPSKVIKGNVRSPAMTGSERSRCRPTNTPNDKEMPRFSKSVVTGSDIVTRPKMEPRVFVPEKSTASVESVSTSRFRFAHFLPDRTHTRSTWRGEGE